MNTLHALVLVLLALQLTGCGRAIPAPERMTVRRPLSPALAPTTLDGLVTDVSGRPLAGARVEIVDGRQTGLTTMTDDAGSFTLEGKFADATQVLASREAYGEAVVSIAQWFRDFPVRKSVSFSLAPSDVVPSSTPLMAGDRFTLTLAADDACTDIPPEFRTRTYEVTIAGDPDPEPPTRWFGVVASGRGREFLDGHDGFPIAVTGQTIMFLLNEDGFPYLSERVKPNAYLAFDGDAWVSVTLRGSVIVASAGGEVNYCEMPWGSSGYYESSNRQCPGPAAVFGQCRFSKLTLTPR